MPEPPVAERRPVVHERHGDRRVDEWHWLRERSAETLAHLAAENAYAEALLAPLVPLREKIYEEIRGRVLESDETAAVPDGAFEWYRRTEEGRAYPIHCRRPRGGGPEERVLDENLLAAGHDFLAIGVLAPSPDQRLLAYGADHDGGERFRLRVRDLDRGTDLPDELTGISYGLAWASDSRTFLYVRADDAERPFQVWRHRLGTPASTDVLVLEEPDEHFVVGVERTRSGGCLLIEAHSHTTSEIHWIPAGEPEAAPVCLRPRVPDVEYSADHWTDGTRERFFVVTNADGARNFRLVAADAERPGDWQEVLPYDDAVRIEDLAVLAGHVVLAERHGGNERLRVLDLRDGTTRVLDAGDPPASIGLGPNREPGATVVRIVRSSPVEPPTDLDCDLRTGAATVVRRQPVPGYDPAAYVTRREWARAADGTEVPISIVHRRDLDLDGTAPALLYGYGSYGLSVDPEFSSARVSLLDRGFVAAVAHVRGGGELGRGWHDAGRGAAKPNTFGDFVACAEHLVAGGYTSAGRIVARGRSAGGLLMGAVANLRPDLFAAIVAEVPFVDVLTTMQDPSLPLTVGEWEEWGDPADPAAYACMRTYSPYDNVAAQAYPTMLVLAGLHDSRVQYWEPAKWVQRVRALGTSGRPVLLHTEMGAGHFGPSGRYDAWREEARTLAFACAAVGAERRR